MTEDEAELRRLFGALAREEGRRELDKHPSAETLSAYRAHELSPEKDRRIQEHLAVCEECTELLLDLEAFTEPVKFVDTPTDFEAAADWRKLQELLSAEDGSGEARKKVDGSYGQPKMAYLAAACALVAVSSLLYAWTLRERLNQPQMNTPMASLQVKWNTRGEEQPEITVPIGDENLLFISLIPPDLAEANYKEYRLEIRDNTGRVVWSKKGLILSDSDTFDIALPRPFLTSERYVLRVMGVAPGPERLVGEYVLKLAELAPDSQRQ